MKRLLTTILVGLYLLTSAFAQTPAPVATKPPPLAIKGTMKISYATRTQLDGSSPKAGVVDTYALNVNVANSVLMKGTVTQLPFIKNTMSANQLGRVAYDMDLDVVNPANPAQTRNVGRLYGSVPVDERNIYHFNEGESVKIVVLPIGAAKGFESRFNGLALAKPPVVKSLMKQAQEAVRLVSSKGGAIVLTKYDKMEFQNHILPAGPVQIYPETTVTGTMFYDYGRSAWHFNNVTFVYGQEGRRYSDTLTGSIRWVESPARKSNGEGEYQFDIRVNEPPPSESAMFAAVADESSFFAVDNNTSALTGTLKYRDTIVAGTVTASDVAIDLTSNGLTKQQVMYLGKLIFLSSVVPLNAE